MRKKWSEKETKYLIKSWDEGISVKAIAEKLNRTETAVNVKASKLDLGRKNDSDDRITLNQLLIALGSKQSTTYFKAKFIKYKAPIIIKKAGKRTNTFINIDDFWKWAEKNKSILNFSRLEPFILGPEPEWVKEKRRLDRNNPKFKNPNRQWTDYDDRLLLEKVKLNRYTYTDLANEFNRTEGAIKKRLFVLNSKLKPIANKEIVKWTQKDDEKLLELDSKNMDAYNMSKILGKPELSVMPRLRLLKELIANNATLVKRLWTDEDEEYLKNNWGILDNQEICQHLNRSYNSVRAKAKRLKEIEENKSNN